MHRCTETRYKAAEEVREMHTIYLRIDQDIDETSMRSLKEKLSGVHYITDVEINARTPRDMLVEFEEDHITPMGIIRRIGRLGVRADIMSA
jgi:hypothetical protein